MKREIKEKIREGIDIDAGARERLRKLPEETTSPHRGEGIPAPEPP
jgi:hypothetical protein